MKLNMENVNVPNKDNIRSRVAWLDIAKAIGLLFIIIGHHIVNKYSISKYIYWFHVPLFFFISGLLHSSAKKSSEFIIARFKHLMVPYCVFVFFVLLMILTGFYKNLSITNLLLGGGFLWGTICTKWWFIPCLFLTQIAGAVIIKTGIQRFVFYAVILSYFVAEMLQIKNTVFMWGTPFVLLKLPFSLEIVPMSLVFYLSGFLLRDWLLSATNLFFPVTILLTCVLILIIMLDWYHIINFPPYFMNVQVYGLPFFNIIIPFICFLLIRELSIALTSLNAAKSIFSSIGRAALPIMFLHLILPKCFINIFFALTGLNYNNLFFNSVLGVLLPLCLYFCLINFDVTKKLLLGEWH